MKDGRRRDYGGRSKKRSRSRARKSRPKKRRSAPRRRAAGSHGSGNSFAGIKNRFVQHLGPDSYRPYEHDAIFRALSQSIGENIHDPGLLPFELHQIKIGTAMAYELPSHNVRRELFVVDSAGRIIGINSLQPAIRIYAMYD